MNYNKFAIPWQVNDSIQSKYIQAGSGSLSNIEVLSIAAGITLDQSRELMSKANSDFHVIAKMTISDLSKIKGISTIKAMRISAIFEIGRRRKCTPVQTRERIRCSKNAYDIMQGKLEDLTYEEFWIILLNKSNQVIDCIRTSQGGISGTVTDIRLILNAAVEKLASAIILVHNHPSGNLSPSEADIKITKKAKEAASFLDISVLDHIIISDSGFMSFADDNLMC